MCLFNCSSYTVGPVLQPASARRPRPLCTGRSAAADAPAPRPLVYYQHIMQPPPPINSRGPVTSSFEGSVPRLLQPRPARSRSGLKFRGGGCKYRRSGRIPGNHFSTRFSRSDASPVDVRNRSDSIEGFSFFFTFQRSLRERI